MANVVGAAVVGFVAAPTQQPVTLDQTSENP
jgi:hypothetical protein